MKVKPNRKAAVCFSLQVLSLPVLALTLLATQALPLFASNTEAGQKTQTAIRGKLVRQMKGTTRPAAYVQVTLSTLDKKQRSVPAYTDAKGMYYLYALKGKYILEIWGNQKEVVRSFYIDVPDKPSFDVAPITIP